jgi:hypothetical protein
MEDVDFFFRFKCNFASGVESQIGKGRVDAGLVGLLRTSGIKNKLCMRNRFISEPPILEHQLDNMLFDPTFYFYICKRENAIQEC